MVTAVIAAFNCRDYIRDTIKSALSQTYEDIEIIVVDDYSTDGTRDVLRNYAERNGKIKIVFLDQNVGPSEARNAGMRLSKGDFIAFLDHDDMWYPDKIRKQVEIFGRDKDVGLVYCDGVLIDRTGNAIGGKKRRLFDYNHPKRGYVFPDLISSNFIPTSSVIFKRSILADIGFFDKKYLIAQDFDYYLKISKKYKIDYVNEQLLRHRWHMGVSTARWETTLKETIAVTMKNLPSGKNMTIGCAIRINRSLMHYYNELGFFYLGQKKYSNARRSFISGILRYPLHPKSFYGIFASMYGGMAAKKT